MNQNSTIKRKLFIILLILREKDVVNNQSEFLPAKVQCKK